MAKKKKSASKPKDLWLITYSDFMTAMFAFFVMLFAMSEIDEQFFQEVALAAQGAQAAAVLDLGGAAMDNVLSSGIMELPGMDMSIFIAPETGQGPGQGPGAGGDVPGQVELAFDVLQTYFGDLAALGAIDPGAIVAELRDGRIVISIHGDVYFASGSALLQPAAMETLAAVGQAIGELPGIRVMIEGHTDNVPIATAQFPSNWQLSAARAISVLQFFVDMGVIEPDRISAVGRSEYHYVADNATPEGRAQNRRVVITLYEQYN